MTLLRHIGLITIKDLRIELRGRAVLATVAPFTVSLLIAFGLSLGPGRALLQNVSPALLWLTVLFAVLLASRQAYAAEMEDGALEGLVLSPVDRAAIFLGKAAAVLVQLAVMEALLIALAIVLFGLRLGNAPLGLALILLLGTMGLALVGSLFGTVAESSRTREAVFPLLVIPLSIPVLVAGIEATAVVTSGGFAAAASWIGLLVAFDAVFASVGILVAGQLLED
jgi:heme exporter protein B